MVQIYKILIRICITHWGNLKKKETKQTLMVQNIQNIEIFDKKKNGFLKPFLIKR